MSGLPTKARLAAAVMAVVAVTAPAAVADEAAQPVASAQAAEGTGAVRTHEIESAALAGNLIGDPPRKRVLVYTPAGYDLETGRRYPVVYLMHGIFDAPEVWIDHFRVPELLDSEIAARRFPPALVVMPEGGNRLGGGFYRNSPVTGNWADFIADELVGFVDATYRTLPSRGSRALLGHSMGGYGAIHLAMERPEVFGTIWAMSPCCLAPVEDVGHGNPVWGDLEQLDEWSDIDAAVEEHDFYRVAAVGLLEAFAPNPERPPFFVDLPFGVERGETVIREPVYSRWAARFPLHRVAAHREALLSLRGLAMDYGIDDQFAHIPEATRRFSARLAELRVPHLLDVYAGDHRQQLRERLGAVVLPFLGRHLEVAAARPAAGSR